VLVFGIDELIEVALRPSRSFFLVNEFEAVLVELLKKLVPGNLLQVFIVTISGIRKAESKDATLVTLVGAANLRRLSATRFRPLANCVVILGLLGKCHCGTSQRNTFCTRWNAAEVCGLYVCRSSTVECKFGFHRGVESSHE